MLRILEIDFENVTHGRIYSDRAHIKIRDVFDLSKSGVGQRLAHSYKLLTSKYIRYGFDGSYVCIYLLLTYLFEHWLRLSRIPRSINITISMSVSKVYARMFQHCISRETWQSVIMRGIETVTFHVSLKFSNMSANNKTSIFKYRSLYSSKVWTENRCQIRRHVHNRSRIPYHQSTNCKMILEMIDASPLTFQRIRLGKCLFASKVGNFRSLILKISKIWFFGDIFNMFCKWNVFFFSYW